MQTSEASFHLAQEAPLSRLLSTDGFGRNAIAHDEGKHSLSPSTQADATGWWSVVGEVAAVYT